jgi:hypothetical protein
MTEGETPSQSAQSIVADLQLQISELQEELATLRAAGKETHMPAPREERAGISSNVELIGDFTALEAEGVDISRGGLCLEVGDPIPFDIKLNTEGQEHVYRGNMAWMKSLEDGSYRLGFEFVRSDLYGG